MMILPKVSVPPIRRSCGAAFALLGAVGLLIGACTYRGNADSNPISRSFTWFSYLNADDIRAYCASGATDRYRVVYNGVWRKQVRTYDITVTGPGQADLVIHVSGEPNIAQPIPLDDLLKPWRGTNRKLRIGAKALASIRAALGESDFYIPPPDGLRIHSWGFFWVAAACENGKFRFNAWQYPSARFDKVTLKGALLPVDTSGIAFKRPHETYEPDYRDEDGRTVDRYTLVVRGNGFASNLKFF